MNNRINKKNSSSRGITQSKRDNNYIRLKTDSIPITILISKENVDTKNIFNRKEIIIKKGEIINKRKTEHTLYAGLLAGPDISTVKFQTVNKTGFSAGLVIGYSLGKKITLETGLFLDKKFYYTEGKFFKPKNFSIPPFIEIDDVYGNCNMIEWPLTLSYTIKSFSKSYLTANTGVSSYFMKSENYSYTYLRNGEENEWDYTSKKSYANMFSVVNIGIAYNYNIFKSYFIRINPYIKIPVYGYGMGRLPVTSAGMHFGVVKRITL